ARRGLGAIQVTRITELWSVALLVSAEGGELAIEAAGALGTGVVGEGSGSVAVLVRSVGRPVAAVGSELLAAWHAAAVSAVIDPVVADLEGRLHDAIAAVAGEHTTGRAARTVQVGVGAVVAGLAFAWGAVAAELEGA